ncbi:MAG: TRAP transporter substrate-binding protein DctP [Deltaproteobacteria bacterium]|nr:TRAP transporter substrate-binding protein DctP [Deltaproteobacteria bacterium]
MKFFSNHPDLVEKELPGVKFLFGYTIAGMAIGTGKVPVRRMEDLRGLKLRVGGRGPAEFYKALGAIPIMLSDADIFMSMKKGAIDGWNSSMNAVALLSLQEVTKYYTQTSFFVGPNVTIMNLKLWNSLPSDMQKQIMSVKGIEWAVETGRIHDRLIEEDTEKAIKAGGEYITLSPEERARWRKVARSLWDKEVAALEARGLPGRALLDEVLQLVEEYGK